MNGRLNSYGLKPLTVYHNLAKFGVHWSSARRNKKFNLLVTSQDHVIERLCDVISEISLLHATTLPSFVALTLVVKI